MAAILRPTDPVRPVKPAGVAAVREHLLAEPLIHTLAGARLDEIERSVALSEEFSLFSEDGLLDGVLWHGGNVSPIGATDAALAAFGAHLRSGRFHPGSIVGRRDQAEALWEQLDGAWAERVREARWSQPLLLAREDSPLPELAPIGLRAAVTGEERAVYPASVAMFREEVGTDPTRYDGGRSYFARITRLIREGRTYVVVDEAGAVVFKADVGARFGDVAQIHGVWTRPEQRGQGIARAAMRELVDLVRADHAPCVSLYVNDFNEAARRAYAAAGYEQAGELTTILF